MIPPPMISPAPPALVFLQFAVSLIAVPAAGALMILRRLDAFRADLAAMKAAPARHQRPAPGPVLELSAWTCGSIAAADYRDDTEGNANVSRL